jgi:hypothetical protein
MQAGEVVLGGVHRDVRDARQVSLPSCIFDHLLSRTAAITPAIEQQQFVVNRLLTVLIPSPLYILRADLRIVGMGAIVIIRRGDEVSQHFSAIQPAPAKRIMWKAIDLIPANLAGEKGIDPALVDDLR